jgi:hypothetical protein
LNRNKPLPRFKSEYFDYDIEKHQIRPKFKYTLISDFQNKFTKQFKRGIYKIFLEERSESVGDAFNSKFDFIREFARYGIGDCPVFYCRPRIPIVFVSPDDIKNPVIRFTEHSENVMKQYGFYTYFFMSHTIAFPVIRNFEITYENYMEFLLKGERTLYSKIIPLEYITDLDFIFSFVVEK